jgi:hypothetical protein
MKTRPGHRVVYVATGERHLREAGASLRSLWRHEPQLSVTMYIDPPSRAHMKEWGIPSPPSSELLDVVDHPAPTYSWADKPLALAWQLLQDERVLFLDTDTRVCGSIMEIFKLLDAFRLAAAHAPVRLGPHQPPALATRAPLAFPELNTGVIAYRTTNDVARLFDRWWSLHQETLRLSGGRAVGDQATFRVALYESDVRFTVLPPEYNCRFAFPTYLHGPVRILHGRGPELESLESQANERSGPRVVVPGVGILRAREMPHERRT